MDFIYKTLYPKIGIFLSMFENENLFSIFYKINHTELNDDINYYALEAGLYNKPIAYCITINQEYDWHPLRITNI